MGRRADFVAHVPIRGMQFLKLAGQRINFLKNKPLLFQRPRRRHNGKWLLHSIFTVPIMAACDRP